MLYESSAIPSGFLLCVHRQQMCKFMCPLLNLQQQGSMYKITGENCESLLAIKHIACDVRLL